MAIFEWRKFNFFELKSEGDNGQVLEAIKEANISCATSGRGQHIICDSSGYIHVFQRNWEFTSFKGHDAEITLCALSTQTNLLITISNEDSNEEIPIYKIWNLTKLTKTSGAPCLRTVRTAVQRPTALGVAENAQFMAIGYENGGISLYRGDITKDRSRSVKSLFSGTNPITGVAFKQQGKVTQMFICSDSAVIVYNLQNKDKEKKVVLDRTFAPTRCSALQSHRSGSDTHFMVGRDDAIYCYTADDRGPCYALDGHKVIIDWYRTHLLAITKPNKPSLSSQKEFVFTIIDIQNKFIVYTTSIDPVAAILIESGACYILLKNKSVFLLMEKDLQSKLNLLFKKNLYDTAIRIAKNQQYDSEGLAGIFKQYGDHLYSKGNFTGAVEQYTKTIGFLEPSYVIRRFLDSRHIYFLTDYLEALHKQGRATADHTTLLLNCFTRLDLSDKLKEFLSNDKNPDIMFDLDVAIKVCRNSSMELALELAKRNQKHNYCISILVEDMNSYEEALNYISKLPLADAEESLRKYGTLFMEKCPDQTADLLKRLCTCFRPSLTDSVTILETESELERVHVDNFIQMFSNNPDKLINFLEYIIANISNSSKQIYNILIELYLYKWKESDKVESRLMDLIKTYDDVYDKDHVLILCRMFDFWPGILWIYEEAELYHLIVRYYLKNRDYENLLATCKRLSSSQPSLWLQALNGLRNDEKASPNLLLQVLNVIASERLQSPLQVLKCLSVENGPNLSHVREYFMQVFQKESERMKGEEANIESLRSRLQIVKDHIENLRSGLLEFRSTICNACQQPLTLPAVYFLCQHSFHQDCIRTYSENEKECGVCYDRYSKLKDALKAQNESRNQHDSFHSILDRSNEPFSVVAKYFGRGLLNKIVIIDEMESQEINQNTIQFTGNTVAITSEYGSGAEAKLRLREGNTKQGIIIPIAESRLRVEEAQKLSKSFGGSSIKDRIATDTRNIFDRKQMQKNKTSDTNASSNSLSKNLSATPKTLKNPFDNDDGYDKRKDPFAEDDDDYDKTKNPFAMDEDKGNSFNDYDNNLNPFAE